MSLTIFVGAHRTRTPHTAQCAAYRIRYRVSHIQLVLPFCYL
ncbi:hypothetical protein HMPREF3190_01179 [Umbribacter vaginalis]|nr:hypothetical protein HMPREF3190_01179 [Coriobacteriales bacterium DNF00809]